MEPHQHNLPDPEILKSLRKAGLSAEADRIEQKAGMRVGAISDILDRFITVDPVCLKLKETVYKLAIHEASVLILGDSGTGKELIAQALGANRKAGRFVGVNVSAIPRDLVESTLFGYARGAFTGAANDREGLIQYAQEGTLFLDEIGDLSLDLQSKFLRVLQDRKVRRVGSNEEEPVKCRIIAATHCDLGEMVKAKTFRLDLYARLSTFILRIPNLSARPNDIAAIMKAFMPDFPIEKVNWNTVDLSFNVRSLEQIAERYKVLGELPL